MQVTKRNGQLEDFDVSKIKRMMSFACEGFPDLQVVELESKTSLEFFDGIKTSQIQQSFIQSANSLASVDEPEWAIVGGRLEMMNLWSDVEFARGYKYKEIPFSEHIQRQVLAGVYDRQYLDCYTTQELDTIGNTIDTSYDLVYDLASAQKWRSTYLLKKESDSQKFITELPQEALLVSALVLASQELPENRLDFAYNLFHQLRERKISLATPMLGNIRSPGGSASSCFITVIDDSLLELGGIMPVINDIAAISKHGGGVGVCLSRIRANGSWIRGQKGLARGVIPWIKIINDVAIAVDQLGKRPGAVTVALDIWHYDIEEFLQLRTENGDDRRKARDIFPQVVVPDLFIQRAKKNQSWYLVCPYEIKTKINVEIDKLWGKEFEAFYQDVIIPAIGNGDLKLFKEISARGLLTELAKISIETGLPYIAFKDAINRANPNKGTGVIPCVNLCVESFSNAAPATETHVCSLVSVNWANCLTIDELIIATKIGVRLLDNSINITTAPIPSATFHNGKYRVIGVGDMGVADHLAHHQLSYDSPEGLDYVNKAFESVALAAFQESVELAKERGTFKAFYESEFVDNIILGREKNWFAKYSSYPEDWKQLFKDIREYGIRNSQLKAIAPNTTSAKLQGCSPTILPVFKKSYLSDGIAIIPPYIKKSFWYYKEYRRYEQHKIIEFVATVQQWIDTGISFEFMYDLNEPRNDGRYMISNIIKANESGIKAIYYVRSIVKNRDENVKEECEACAN
jgi:ribonucleoside-diphosphate reductase alpha chain